MMQITVLSRVILSSFILIFLLVVNAISAAEPTKTKATSVDKPLTPANAEECLRTDAEKARKDPDRPVYHFLPPSHWMNDPNGPIFHKGWYHMFYQLNPFWDIHGGGAACWGHARSRDMVHWEHQPIALFPSIDQGEHHCYSGSCTTDASGRPTIIYTSIHQNEYDDAEQWAAVSDDDMVHWKKLETNPVMTQALHGTEIIRHWRDPMIFKHDGKTYMVIGGSRWEKAEPHGVVLLYRATRPDLTAWEYLGVAYEFQDPHMYLNEVPNLFPLGGKWLLISNPMAQKCLIGNLNFNTFTFEPETEAAPTWGDFNIRVAQVDTDPNRAILWGFVADFKRQLTESRGWCNCLTLPRVLTMRPNGKLQVEPLEALSSLRGQLLADEADIIVQNGSSHQTAIRSDCMEINAMLHPEKTLLSGIRICVSPDHRRFVSVQVEAFNQWNKGPHFVINGTALRCTPAKIPFALAEGEKDVQIRIYLDKSVLEVFVNGRISYTGVVERTPEDTGVSLFAEGGSMTVPRFQAWEMKSIWQTN